MTNSSYAIDYVNWRLNGISITNPISYTYQVFKPQYVIEHPVLSILPEYKNILNIIERQFDYVEYITEEILISHHIHEQLKELYNARPVLFNNFRYKTHPHLLDCVHDYFFTFINKSDHKRILRSNVDISKYGLILYMNGINVFDKKNAYFHGTDPSPLLIEYLIDHNLPIPLTSIRLLYYKNNHKIMNTFRDMMDDKFIIEHKISCLDVRPPLYLIMDVDVKYIQPQDHIITTDKSVTHHNIHITGLGLVETSQLLYHYVNRGHHVTIGSISTDDIEEYEDIFWSNSNIYRSILDHVTSNILSPLLLRFKITKVSRCAGFEDVIIVCY